MNGAEKIYKYITDRKYRFMINASMGFYKNMDDRTYLEKMFFSKLGVELDLKNPKRFNEKLQWLKLYNRNPDYTDWVDKYKVREYVSRVLGEQYLIPLVGVWKSEEDIDFDSLPNAFVLKCNHNSGLGMYICKDKSKLSGRDLKQIRQGLKKGLRQDYYLTGREWPYKNVERRIICEQYMEDSSGELRDYKFMCFHGKVACSFVCSGRNTKEGLHVTFMNRNWEIMPFERHYPRLINPPQKPQNYEKMVDFAERLSANIPFVRIDFYETEGNLYFGEITFYPGSGMEEFTPDNWDYKLGDLINLGDLNR